MERSSGRGERTQHLFMSASAGFLILAFLALGKPLGAEAETLLAQMGPMRQESIPLGHKMASVPETPGRAGESGEGEDSGVEQRAIAESRPDEGGVSIGYDPAGRRDPFAPVIQDLQLGRLDENLPPLQRVGLTELNLIAIVWGAHGYTAMVQTPEGHGYSVRRGTRIGQNNGVVSAITERGIIIQERFTDVYGRKQEREFVKLLHPKEGSE
ncbi:MAG: pilus assembly protein PilP [Nitrospira sp.]|nr:pilus assembly protein PilP [Nitrospira sp.]MCP9442508.1 pilus assembly protein PilP [Nitrospira sp.]